MEDKIYLLDEFKAWIKDRVTPHVASNYPSWLKKLDREFISQIPTGTRDQATPMGLLYEYTSPKKSAKGPKINLIEELLIAIASRISTQKKALKGSPNSGEFNSESSAFNAYATFILEYTAKHPHRKNENITPTEWAALSNIKGEETVLNQETVIGIFISRLNTQDRITGEKTYLPLDLVAKLLPKETREWVKEEANRVRIYFENSDLPITEIKEIRVGNINPNQPCEKVSVAAVWMDGTKHIVYNPPIKGKKFPMNVTVFSDTDIDHDREIHDILMQLQGQLPGLDFLTEAIKKKQQELGLRTIDATNCNQIYDALLTDSAFMSVCVDRIKTIPEEMKLISSKHGLQLASSDWNRSTKKQANKTNNKKQQNKIYKQS